MIYLNAEVISGLGEDTFWTWFKREFPSSSFETPKELNSEDVVLRYSTLGFLPLVGKQIALCWELYPEMKRFFHINQWDPIINKVRETARYATYRTVATEYSISDYSEFGSVDVIPIGVDCDKFKPLQNKEELRIKYNIPLGIRVGIWVGTLHPMKGFMELAKYASLHPDIHWIVVWKWAPEAGVFPGASNFVKVEQQVLVELINASDFFLFTSLLKPYYMSEWEAMACDIPIINIGTEREFKIPDEPRKEVFKRGWDRESVKMRWSNYLIERGIKW
jgi:glycosyltransferase involved in cell wall biosynthesis